MIKKAKLSRISWYYIPGIQWFLTDLSHTHFKPFNTKLYCYVSDRMILVLQQFHFWQEATLLPVSPKIKIISEKKHQSIEGLKNSAGKELLHSVQHLYLLLLFTGIRIQHSPCYYLMQQCLKEYLFSWHLCFPLLTLKRFKGVAQIALHYLVKLY